MSITTSVLGHPPSTSPSLPCKVNVINNTEFPPNAHTHTGLLVPGLESGLWLGQPHEICGDQPAPNRSIDGVQLQQTSGHYHKMHSVTTPFAQPMDLWSTASSLISCPSPLPSSATVSDTFVCVYAQLWDVSGLRTYQTES